MRIARFTTGDEPAYGVVTGDLDESGQPAEDASSSRSPATRCTSASSCSTRSTLADVRLLAPVLPRSKVVGIGRNYARARRRARQRGARRAAASSSSPTPAWSARTTRSSTRHQTQDLHYEGELAVVIGRICRDVPAEQATDVIHGYTIGNDVTARDLQRSDKQFTRAKGFDSFCPLGPWIETDLDPQHFIDGVADPDPPQRRRRAGRHDRRHDLRHPHADRLRLQRDDAAARATSSSPAPPRVSVRWRSATRSRSRSPASAL